MALPTNSTQLSTMRPHRLSQFLKISASDVGIDDADGDTTPNSNWIPCAGYNQCTLLIKFVDEGTGTPATMTFGIDVSDDQSTAYIMQTSAVSSGVATLSKLVFTKANAANASMNYMVDFPLSYEFFRVNTLTVSGGHANHDMSVTCFLGNI